MRNVVAHDETKTGEDVFQFCQRITDGALTGVAVTFAQLEFVAAQRNREQGIEADEGEAA